jgi:hypothetical protein
MYAAYHSINRFPDQSDTPVRLGETSQQRVAYFLPKLERETVAWSNVLSNTVQVMSACEKRFLLNTAVLLFQSACVPWKKLSLQVTFGISRPIMQC